MTQCDMWHLSDGAPSMPISDVFEDSDKVNVGYVQELLIALANAKTEDGKPEMFKMHKATPYNLLFQAVLWLMEKQQPGIMGYRRDDEL
jgi:hypothetical protein